MHFATSVIELWVLKLYPYCMWVNWINRNNDMIKYWYCWKYTAVLSNLTVLSSRIRTQVLMMSSQSKKLDFFFRSKEITVSTELWANLDFYFPQLPEFWHFIFSYGCPISRASHLPCRCVLLVGVWLVWLNAHKVPRAVIVLKGSRWLPRYWFLSLSASRKAAERITVHSRPYKTLLGYLRTENHEESRFLELWSRSSVLLCVFKMCVCDTHPCIWVILCLRWFLECGNT